MEDKARCFLRRFVEEVQIGPDDPLPVSPLSRARVSQDELPGESLELGLRLLSARDAPQALSSLLCQAALSELLKSDLSPFHCTQENESGEEEEHGVLLSSESIQRFFLNKVKEVAVAWQRDLPAFPAGASQPPRYAVHAIRNVRRKMEDKHVAVAEFNQLFGFQDGVDRRYYAVFDGHGGVDAATYAATHLHVALSKQETLHSDVATAFKAAFSHVDEMFRGKAKRERLRSGSTGVAAFLQDQCLSVAWLGDSQAMLVRRGRAVTLMEPHKPEREDEKQRIEDLGGCVTFMGCWRVNGTYAVSRAIGDFDQKPYVSGDADCATVQLSGDEDYVLLACDGFFDMVKPAEVPQLVLEALREPGDLDGAGDAAGPKATSADAVAQKLVQHARAAGSSDNITVMVVFLRSPEQLAQDIAKKAPAEAAQASDSQSKSGKE